MFIKSLFFIFFLTVVVDGQTCYNALLSGTSYLCPTGLTLTGTQCCSTTTSTANLTDCASALLVNGTYVCPTSLILSGSLCCNSTSSTTTTTCVDLKNARTGVSDCPSRAFLCNNTLYYSLMTQQCPKTCNRCSSTTSTNSTSSSCVDLTNPTTGVSDCSTLSYLCTNTRYIALMRVQCKATCGFCTSG